MLIIRLCVDTCWKTFKIILLSNIVYLVNIDNSYCERNIAALLIRLGFLR